jgi:MoaA/NifB/PqqE/SkfB family radical SAM enzyme
MFLGTEKQIQEYSQRLLEQFAHLQDPQEECPFPPLCIDVDLTNKCNLKCISCFHSSSQFKSLPMMTWEMYRTVLDQAEGVCSFLTFGNHGENLLHPESIPMIAEAKKRGFFVNLITNGTLLDPVKAHSLVDMGIDRVVFSLDSMDAKTYEDIRRGAQFNKVLENVLYFLKYNYEKSLPVYVNISTVNTKKAISSKLTVFDFFKKLPVHVVYTSDLLNFHGAAEEINDETYFEKRYKEVSREDAPVCMMGWDRLLVRPNGECTFCTVDWNYGYDLGNVADEDFMVLWNNKRARTFRKALLTRDYTTIEKDACLCSKCDAKFACSSTHKLRWIEKIFYQMCCADSKQAKIITDGEKKYREVCNQINKICNEKKQEKPVL